MIRSSTTPSLLLALTLATASFAALADRPPVGSTVELNGVYDKQIGMTLPGYLYQSPATGYESHTDRQALRRWVDENGRTVCSFSRVDSAALPRGKVPYVFTVNGFQEVAGPAVNGRPRSILWMQVTNLYKPGCTGWIDRGATTDVNNRVSEPVVANTPPSFAPVPGQQYEPGQPPGFFCPVGWMPNPSGKVGKNGSFRCFASSSTPIPAGYRCPGNLKLLDSSPGLVACEVPR